MGSSSFYVDERYRGQGGRVFLQYCRLGKTMPLFGTSANVHASSLWKASVASPIPYSEGELFGILNWPPVAEEFAHRKYSSPLLTRAAASPLSYAAGLLGHLKVGGSSGSLQRLTSAEEVVALPIHDPPSKLTALRDLSYIRWRYFSDQDASAAAFAFRSAELDREVLVTVNQRPRGHRSQIKTLNVLDVYPEIAADHYTRIVGALIDHYKNAVDAVVLRSLNQDLQKILIEKGFKPRMFDAPNGWFLDKQKILRGLDWYPVPADGDGLI